ncbi:hypothetical protein AOA59_29565, partial [Pseudomonas sp. 2822-15]|uniref:hypothetical protein n=1 Tax=Pseudomonas sp. 2822-15 TaxID=1712677 RepID=UPI000C43D609
ELEGVGGFEARGVAGHVVAQLVALALLFEGGDGALVEDVAGDGGGEYFQAVACALVLAV